jgi:hypothetical protein
MAGTEGDGRNLSRAVAGAEAGTAAVGRTKPETARLLEAALERSNMLCAYERVVKNKGAPGVDGLTGAEADPALSGQSLKQVIEQLNPVLRGGAGFVAGYRLRSSPVS